MKRGPRPQRAQVLAAIEQAWPSYIGVDEVAERSGASQATVRKWTRRLADEGVIELMIDLQNYDPPLPFARLNRPAPPRPHPFDSSPDEPTPLVGIPEREARR